MSAYILAIDQGTTSTRAVVYDLDGKVVAIDQREFPQLYPRPDHVEHDPEQIWGSVQEVVRGVLSGSGIKPDQIGAIGITNQRETTVLWDRESGKPIYNAIVWQDRRTAQICREWQTDEELIRERTGLVSHPYFSASKIRWLLDNVPRVRERAERGELAFGTIDCFLIWRLTGGQVHATDVTNASRTMLFNIRSESWDGELCHRFSIPESLLPEVRRSATSFGETRGLDFLPDGIPVCGVAGDQQASLFGQGCWSYGEAKCTYGTGAFLLVHLADQFVLSRSGLITTVAASLQDQPLQYALEGSLFIAGAAIQWLRDALGVIEAAPQVNELAAKARPDSEVVFVPALAGLGAPYWVPEAQGTIFGLTRATGAAELARATLESIALQVRDLVRAIQEDTHLTLSRLRVDGGTSKSNLLIGLQADVLGYPVERMAQGESTALGAAMLAALGAGLADPERVASWVQVERTFEPSAKPEQVQALIRRWEHAVQTTIEHYRRGH